MVSLNKAEHDAKMIALAHEAIAHLTGSCQGFVDLGPEFEEAETDKIFCATIDENIFCCEQCGWWFEQNEMANRKDEEWICEDCTDDEDLKND